MVSMLKMVDESDGGLSEIWALFWTFIVFSGLLHPDGLFYRIVSLSFTAANVLLCPFRA